MRKKVFWAGFWVAVITGGFVEFRSGSDWGDVVSCSIGIIAMILSVFGSSALFREDV